jgi:prolipoprotein diacylglyceryltransferase
MEPSVWIAFPFVLVCYGILLVISLLVAGLIVVVRWATAPRGKPTPQPVNSARAGR